MILPTFVGLHRLFDGSLDKHDALRGLDFWFVIYAGILVALKPPGKHGSH